MPAVVAGSMVEEAGASAAEVASPAAVIMEEVSAAVTEEAVSHAGDIPALVIMGAPSAGTAEATVPDAAWVQHAVPTAACAAAQ
jgi:hypothetical protein